METQCQRIALGREPVDMHGGPFLLWVLGFCGMFSCLYHDSEWDSSILGSTWDGIRFPWKAGPSEAVRRSQKMVLYFPRWETPLTPVQDIYWLLIFKKNTYTVWWACLNLADINTPDSAVILWDALSHAVLQMRKLKVVLAWVTWSRDDPMFPHFLFALLCLHPMVLLSWSM